MLVSARTRRSILLTHTINAFGHSAGTSQYAGTYRETADTGFKHLIMRSFGGEGASDVDVAMDEHVMVNRTSSRSTLIVLAFVALAVVTLGTLRTLQRDILSRKTLDRVSTTQRNASTRVTTVTIATSSHTAPRPSFAVCVVGQVRAMARRDVREHARAVLTTPLIEDGGDVEVFLHLDAKGMDEIIENTLREFWSPTSLEVYEVENRGNVGRAGCLSAGWPQTFRQRACAEDVRRRERERNETFDWIVLTRPDIEYYAKLPRASAWMGLKKNLILSGMCWFKRDGEIDANRQVAKGVDVDFMTDALAIVSRDTMDHYASIADAFESCIPANPPSDNPCGSLWASSECRAQHVAVNHTVGRLISEGDGGEMYRAIIFRCDDARCSHMHRDYCKIEPCDVDTRPLDVVFAEEDGKKVRFTSEYYFSQPMDT